MSRLINFLTIILTMLICIPEAEAGGRCRQTRRSGCVVQPRCCSPTIYAGSAKGVTILNACGYQTTVCKGSLIPEGFLIVGQDTDFNCSSSFDNVWVIQRYNTCSVGQQMTICKGQAVPIGWGIKATVTNFSCGSDFDNAWVIERIN